MGNKKRNPTRSAAASPPCDSTPEIKSECERSLTALRRGNPTKALRLMRDALGKYGDSALVHRVHGAVHAQLTAMIEDPVVKQRHLKNAFDSAQRATELAPNSIEFAHFYASLLFDYMADLDGYELAVAECNRALCVKNPVDPAEELLHVSEETDASTPEVRIKQVQGEISNLMQKCNVASLSIWMKTMNMDTNHVTPVHSFNEQVEYSVPTGPTAHPPRRNEIKKASKTLDERRKEIEVRVTAARLLQQQHADPGQSPSVTSSDSHIEDEHSPGVASSSSSSGFHRRKPVSRKPVSSSSSNHMDQVRAYWNSMPFSVMY